MHTKPLQQEGRQYPPRTRGGVGGSTDGVQMYTAIVNLDTRVIKLQNNGNSSVTGDNKHKVFPLL